MSKLFSDGKNIDYFIDRMDSDKSIYELYDDVVSLREKLSIAKAPSSELFRLREQVAKHESVMIKERIEWRKSLRKQRDRARKVEQQLAQALHK